MSQPEKSPKLPQWIFFLTDAVLLGTAWYIASQSAQPLSSTAMLAIVGCIIAGAIVALVPVVAHYERIKNQMLDDRQRALEALAATLSASAEQISIAAGSLHSIAEISQKNLRHAEQLPHKLQEKIAEFNAQLDNAREDDREELEKELADLRASETERLQSASDKIHKAVADLNKLEASAQKHLAATSETLAKAQAGSATALAEASTIASQALATASAESSRRLSAAATEASRAIATAQAAAVADLEAKLAAQTATAVAAIEAALSKPVVVVAAAPQAAPDEAAPKAAENNLAAEVPVTPPAETPVAPPAPKRPRKPRREEPAASPEAESPQPAEASVEPVVETPAEMPVAPAAASDLAVVVESPASTDEAAPVEIATTEPATPAATEPPPAAPPVTSPPEPTAALPAEPASTDTISRFVETEPAAVVVSPQPEEPEPAPKSTRKRGKKPIADPSAELTLGPAIDDFSQAAPDDSSSGSEIVEKVITSDGATRLLVTAYIGIGNRLFVRGEGPGLSWEKGVPLQFVSIGKWRWETAEATGPVACKLYKNDETECTALGALTLDPGHQQEVAARF